MSYVCKCPIHDCNRDLQNLMMYNYLPKELLESIENRMLNNKNRIKEIESFILPEGMEAKHCPFCKIPVIRSEGCDDMICHACGRNFDYSAAEDVQSKIQSLF